MKSIAPLTISRTDKAEPAHTVNLLPPIGISARLLPSVKVGDAYISVEPTGRRDDYGRTVWRTLIDCPDFEYSDEELRTHGDHREALSSACAFLGACGESYRYEADGRGENADLYPPHVAEWASQNEDELSMAQMEIDEAPEE